MSQVLHGAGFISYADMSEVGRLQRNLKAYVQYRRKIPEDEILSKKGNDLRIQLFKAFWAHRFILKKKAKSNWRAVLKKIVKGGKGIKVRLSYLKSPWESQIPDTDKNGNKLSMRQKLVAQEILRRISGTGVLGVSFLGNRRRFTKAGTFLVTNRTNTLGVAAIFQKRDDEYIIRGFTPGLLKIAQRYGVLKTALSAVSQNIENYLSSRISPAFVEALHAR